MIDEVQLYNVALSNAHVATLSARASGGPSVAGVRGRWSFEEGSGTTAFDTSGETNDATLYGPQWTIGRIGRALRFDGDDSIRVAPDGAAGPLNAPTAVSVATWVKFDDLTGRQKMLYKGATNQVNYSLGKSESGNKFEFFFTRGGTDTFLFSNTTIVPGRWYHVAATYDGAFASIYVNGQLDTSQAYTGALATTTEELRLGWLNWSDYLRGVLDEPQVYDRSLSPEEVQQLAAVPASVDWPFDEGTGGVTFDRSGNGLLGFLTSPSWVSGKSGAGLCVLPQPERDGPTAVVQTRQGASRWQSGPADSSAPSRRSRS